MKLNYYTYTINFTKQGTKRKICIKDIVDIFCQYQTDETKLVKKNKSTERELYFAKSSLHDTVFYLMTPTDLHEYRSLDKSSGKITDLKTLIGSDSLEKVTYVHIDSKRPIIGIATSRGGSTDEDLQFYLNQILNGLSSDEPYELTLFPLSSKVNRSDVKKLKMISQAKVVLSSKSSQTAKLAKFLNNGKASKNLEIEISIKRTNAQANSIEKDIAPLLDLIEHDTNSNDFAKVYFRGKRESLAEYVKDMHLDESLVQYDMIHPKSNRTIEDEVETKRYANPQVDALADDYFDSMHTKMKTVTPCTNWNKLKDLKSY